MLDQTAARTSTERLSPTTVPIVGTTAGIPASTGDDRDTGDAADFRKVTAADAPTLTDVDTVARADVDTAA
jgi:hypothetical protein